MKLLGCRLQGQTGHEAGWQLLERLYREETGEEAPPVCFGPRGKPYFTEGFYYFSISHTKDHAFCVLAKEEIGLDAEELSRKVNLRLAEKILSPGEKAQFDTAPDQNRALLTFWVLKEAAAKCTGEGIQGYPRETNFSLDDPRVREIDGCLVAVIVK